MNRSLASVAQSKVRLTASDCLGQCSWRASVSLMSSTEAQEELRRFWLGGKEGALCGREQARAWALRAVWKEEHDYGVGR